MRLLELVHPHATGIALYGIDLIRLPPRRTGAWCMRRRRTAGTISLFDAACARGTKNGGEGVVAGVGLHADESC